MKMHRYFCLVIGRWKLENWRLYRYREHRSARNASIRWMDWDCVL